MYWVNYHMNIFYVVVQGDKAKLYVKLSKFSLYKINLNRLFKS